MSASRQLSFVVVFLAVVRCGTTAAQPQLTDALIASGGTTMDSPNHVARGSFGQTLTGSSSSQSYAIDAGFWLEWGGTPTSVDDVPGRPRVLSLAQNFPNPFNPRTTIAFAVPTITRVQLRVYDLAGRLVDELVDETRGPGVYEQVFAPVGLASGVYVVRLRADGVVLRRKLVLLK